MRFVSTLIVLLNSIDPGVLWGSIFQAPVPNLGPHFELLALEPILRQKSYTKIQDTRFFFHVGYNQQITLAQSYYPTNKVKMKQM